MNQAWNRGAFPQTADAQAAFERGATAYRQGNLAAAAEHFAEACRLDPSDANAAMRLGVALLGLHKLSEARKAADAAAALDSGNPSVLDSLGVLYGKLGAFAESAAFARMAVDRDPRNALYQFNLGWAEQYEGDLDAAAAAFRAATRLNPDFEKAWLALVEVERQTAETNHREVLERLFAAGGSPERLLAVGHALAKVAEDLGDHERALDWLERAKAPRRSQIGYRPEADRMMFEAAAETWAGAGEDGFHDAAPIFVVGMPRTGTTLVERILSSHPDVASAGELKTFPIQIKRASSSATRRLADADTFRRANGLPFRRIGLDYAAAAHLAAGPSKRFIDKLPFNFLYAGLILRALPEAKIICLRRDPMDTVLSNYRQAFGTQSDFHDYTFSLEDIAAYYASFERLVAHWRQALPAERFTEVGYEALIADQEAETRRLVDFCGLGWDDACLRPHENGSGVSTASAAQVRKPIHGGSVGRWRKWGERMEPVKAALQAEGIKLEG